jgi:hypothetical protein
LTPDRRNQSRSVSPETWERARTSPYSPSSPILYPRAPDYPFSTEPTPTTDDSYVNRRYASPKGERHLEGNMLEATLAADAVFAEAIKDRLVKLETLNPKP